MRTKVWESQEDWENFVKSNWERVKSILTEDQVIKLEKLADNFSDSHNEEEGYGVVNRYGVLVMIMDTINTILPIPGYISS